MATVSIPARKYGPQYRMNCSADGTTIGWAPVRIRTAGKLMYTSSVHPVSQYGRRQQVLEAYPAPAGAR